MLSTLSTLIAAVCIGAKMDYPRGGQALFDLDKLQMTDPTNFFGSKKGAGLVKPHVIDVKACICRGSPQSTVVVEDKMSLDSKHNPDEIPFEPADQPEGT